MSEKKPNKLPSDYNKNRKGIYLDEKDRELIQSVGEYWERQGVNVRVKGAFSAAKVFSLLLAREALRIQAEEAEKLHK